VGTQTQHSYYDLFKSNRQTTTYNQPAHSKKTWYFVSLFVSWDWEDRRRRIRSDKERMSRGRSDSSSWLRWCLVLFAMISALMVCGPALYWRFKNGITLNSKLSSCPPCTCHCPPPLSLFQLAPGNLTLSLSLSLFRSIFLSFFNSLLNLSSYSFLTGLANLSVSGYTFFSWILSNCCYALLIWLLLC